MELKMYELTKTDACQAKRAFAFMLEGREEDHFKKAVAIKGAIKEIVAGNLKEEDLMDWLKEKFSDIAYPSQRQREIHTADAARMILRYIHSEKRSLVAVKPQTVSLGHGLDVLTTPDYAVITDTSVEVFKIKCSKPNIAQKGAVGDLGLYAMLQLARALVAPGEEKTVSASYYFLRKENDSSSVDKPTFDPDFFLLEGGRNIVTLTEKGWKNTAPYQETAIDKAFAPYVERFVEGLPKEECSKADCEKCNLYDVCKYQASPTALVKTTVQKKLADLQLTSAQEQAVEYEYGICRVNAGAGAGKTMVIALRTAVLINKGFDPSHLLLITFTNAGAEEMRSRIRAVLSDFGLEEAADKVVILTFNAFGDSVLKKEYAKLGFSAEPKVIDDVERSRIIADLLNEHTIAGLDYRNFDSDLKFCKGALAVAKQVFDLVKKNRYSVGDENEVYAQLGHSFADINAVRELIALYDQYDAILRAENLIEFSDQESMLFEIIHQDPYYLEQFGYEHIIVDEFQDTSAGQLELVKLMIECPSFKSLMVVGDDSQSIFGFRDTSPEYILKFPELIGKPVDDIILDKNHRSTPQVIATANNMNAMRVRRVDKNLVATRPDGLPVRVEGFLTKQEETEFLIQDIQAHLAAGTKPEEIAIITATKYELLEMADILGKEGIPTVLLNPEPLVDNSRVRAAIAMLAAVRDKSDTKDLLTYANAKARGGLMTADKETIEAAMQEAAAELEGYHAIPDEPAKKAKLMELLKALDANDDEVYESFLKTLEFKNTEKMFAYADDFYRFGSGNAVRRTHDYPGIALTTAHSSKGLEWNVVYNLISKYDGEEMHRNSEASRNAVEERKRLLFVSMTRARDELIITARYDAFGKRGDYTYNQFLADAMDCVGKVFDPTAIEAERKRREDEKKAAKKAAEKAKKEAEAKKNLQEMEASLLPVGA